MTKTLPLETSTKMPVILDGNGFFVELPYDVSTKIKKFLQETIAGTNDVATFEKRLKLIKEETFICRRGVFRLIKDQKPASRRLCFSFKFRNTRKDNEGNMLVEKFSSLIPPKSDTDRYIDEDFQAITPEEFQEGESALASLFKSQKEDPISFYNRMMEED